MKANQLLLLQQLYGKVLIPRAVYRELTENPVYTEEADVIKRAGYVSVVETENEKAVNILRAWMQVRAKHLFCMMNKKQTFC